MTCMCVSGVLLHVQADELPVDLYEFHEVVSSMQQAEEALVDGHRELCDVRHTYHCHC